MKISKTSSNLAQVTPGRIVEESQLAVGAVLVAIATAPAGTTYSYVLTNRSAGGQIIRVGIAPTFGAPVAGMSILPNESLSLNNVSGTLNAIADLAGGLLDRLVANP